MTEAKKAGEALPPLKSRLVDAMADMVNPQKTKTAKVPTKSGGSYQYKYESLDQVLAAVRPPLMERKIGLTQRQVWSENTGSFALETVVFDGSEEIVLDTRPMRDSPDAQASGSWETYMRRYALRSAFGLAGEDDDGAAAKGAAQGHRAAPAPKRPGKWDEFKRLKAEAVALGVRDESIKEWMNATFKKDMRSYTPGDINLCEAHVRQLIEDMKKLGAVTMDESMDEVQPDDDSKTQGIA